MSKSIKVQIWNHVLPPQLISHPVWDQVWDQVQEQDISYQVFKQICKQIHNQIYDQDRAREGGLI